MIKRYSPKCVKSLAVMINDLHGQFVRHSDLTVLNIKYAKLMGTNDSLRSKNKTLTKQLKAYKEYLVK